MVSGKIKVVIVAGTRPNFIKIAPLVKELKRHALVEFVLINTGQHYDFEMAGIFFKDLQIKTPDYNLGIGSGSHAYQMGTMMIEIEKIIIKENPTAVIVVGDVNSTLAAALTAKKLGVSVVHIEAGLRSGDERMPEETNRILTDHISDVLFCTEPGAVKNLLREGISKKKIYYVGNIMIDTLLAHKSSFDGYGKKIMQNFQLKPKEYALLTLHRQENVDRR
jgi:UDP-N-acetylglucosamine 2-epimerase (non-hydrolysing)